MNYEQIYLKIVNRALNRNNDGYVEKHHILPKCMGGTNDATNIVKLTPEEHFICHLLLVKIYSNNHRLVYAANMLTVSSEYVKRNSNKRYGWLKRKFSLAQKELWADADERREKSSLRMKNNNPSKNGAWNKGLSVKTRKTDITKEERESISNRMISNNPCSAVKPWKHPRATEYSKSIWKQADKIYQIWVNNSEPSYCKLYTLVNGKFYINEGGKVIGPYMNMVKYFRNNWIPTQDSEWNSFNKEIKRCQYLT